MAIGRWSENPNVIDDLQKYVFCDSDKAVLEEKMNMLKLKSPDQYQQVIRYLDILELIQHMKIVADEAKLQRYKFHGQEIKGIDADIDALVFYLALSAVDVISPNISYTVFSSWITNKKNVADYDYKTDICQYISEKYNKVYKKTNGMNSGFKTVGYDMPEEFQKSLVQNVSYLKVKNMEDLLLHLTPCECDKDIGKEYKAIWNFCTRLRDVYTHDMYRVQKPLETTTAPYILCKGQDLSDLVGGKNKDKVEVLIVYNGFDLENALLEISRSYCKGLFKE